MFRSLLLILCALSFVARAEDSLVELTQKDVAKLIDAVVKADQGALNKSAERLRIYLVDENDGQEPVFFNELTSKLAAARNTWSLKRSVFDAFLSPGGLDLAPLWKITRHPFDWIWYFKKQLSKACSIKTPVSSKLSCDEVALLLAAFFDFTQSSQNVEFLRLNTTEQSLREFVDVIQTFTLENASTQLENGKLQSAQALCRIHKSISLFYFGEESADKDERSFDSLLRKFIFNYPQFIVSLKERIEQDSDTRARLMNFQLFN